MSKSARFVRISPALPNVQQGIRQGGLQPQLVDNVSVRKIRQLYLLEILKLTGYYPVPRDRMSTNLETSHCSTGSLRFP